MALSILLHSAIVAAAVYGWFTWKHRPPPVETLAIEATVVDERALKGIATKPEPAPPPPEPEPVPEPVPEPPPVEEQGPPKPDPAELQRKEEERLAQAKLNEERAEKEKAELKAAQDLKEREDAEKLEAEKKAAAKAAADKAAADKAAADKKALDKKRADDAAAAKKAAEEKARQARQAELQRALEAEERGNAMRNSDEANRWHAQIIARVTRAWIKPPSAQPGISCIVSVTQVPGGEVTAVNVNSCSINDAALRESVEAAVLRASPLPPPPDPALFERNLELTFAPQ
ncbi:MAG TPA: cell envelope integrity protein TolA [Steroidobacteraceae bacterium]|nr:cell envelope integrity protein TolA [Steroidobacteraceae bacterium]